MASSSTLCKHNQNKHQQGFSGVLKTHNEQCKAPGVMNVSKPSTVHHGSKRGLENQDPSAPEKGTSTANKLKGVSRLPVLAKTLQQSATTEPPQIKWEERPLLGKEKRKKTCTKPQPFSLSQSRAGRFGTQRQEQASIETTGKVRTISATHPTLPRPAKTLSTVHPKPKTGTSAPSRTKLAGPATLSGTSTDTGSLSGDRCHNVHSQQVHEDSENRTSDSLSTGKTVTQFDVSRDISLHLGGISLASSKHVARAKDDGQSEASGHKTLFRTPHSHAGPQRVAVKTKSQTAQPTPSVHEPVSTTEAFCDDPSALRSILQSEGLPGSVPLPSGRGTSVYLPQRVSVLKSAQRQKPEASTGKPQAFSPDPAALDSILLNEGIQSAAPSGGATARASACPPGRATSVYSAQRVPVSKSRTKEVSVTQGNAVTFSPDVAALRSILQNEGIQAGGATPRTSVCPSGRGTSVYTAQRVPVTKSRSELMAASLGPARSSPSLTPAVKWTPLRVPNTKPQSTKRLLSAYRAPKFSGSPAIRVVQHSSSSELPSNTEDAVVQRLFGEQEEEEEKMEDGGDQRAVAQVARNSEREEEAEAPMTQETPCPAPVHPAQPSQGPLLQAAHRDSVIVLCSGQRLFGQTPARGATAGPATHTQASSSDPQEPHAPSSLPVGTLPGAIHQSSGSKVITGLESTVSTKATPLCQKKMLELRRRLPILEDLILDEECATYMSQPQYSVAFPRCSNPVASSLLFHDSTCFVPIGLVCASPTSCSV